MFIKNMKAVYIVSDRKDALILIDPMRRAILDLLRRKPMTQAQLAGELGLSAPSLNFHIKKLRTRRLVVIAKREIEKHRIMQTFFASIAYFFVYDLELLPKNIARYFYPVSLERARSVLSTTSLNQKGKFEPSYTCDQVNKLAQDLSRSIVKIARTYQKRNVGFGEEEIVNEIYKKSIGITISRK
jgi:DNA-binding transcriptional ArsR family regulator